MKAMYAACFLTFKGVVSVGATRAPTPAFPSPTYG